MLFKEYKRNYENFDKCLKAFEDIIIICQKQNNYEIANIIENTLNSLDLIKNNRGNND